MKVVKKDENEFKPMDSESNPAKPVSDMCSEELMKDNLVYYTLNGKRRVYKVYLIAPAELFLQPVEAVSASNPQIKCFVYMVEPIPISSDIWEQLPVSMNDVPASITHVHELQNWYYWNNGKKSLNLNIKQ